MCSSAQTFQNEHRSAGEGAGSLHPWGTQPGWPLLTGALYNQTQGGRRGHVPGLCWQSKVMRGRLKGTLSPARKTEEPSHPTGFISGQSGSLESSLVLRSHALVTWEEPGLGSAFPYAHQLALHTPLTVQSLVHEAQMALPRDPRAHQGHTHGAVP